MSVKLLLKEISDRYARENFQKLEKEAQSNKLRDFSFIDIELDEAVTERLHPHGFNGTPLDVLVVHQTPGVTVTWHYDDFDSKNLYFTTTGACRIRAFVGRYNV